MAENGFCCKGKAKGDIIHLFIIISLMIILLIIMIDIMSYLGLKAKGYNFVSLLYQGDMYSCQHQHKDDAVRWCYVLPRY